MFTKRHYKALVVVMADSLCNSLDKYMCTNAASDMVADICKMLKADNPNFNEVEFMKAFHKAMN